MGMKHNVSSRVLTDWQTYSVLISSIVNILVHFVIYQYVKVKENFFPSINLFSGNAIN